MTIKFATYRGASLNSEEKEFIKNVILSFNITDNYYSVLQKLYNHNLHFTTVPNTLDLCSNNSLLEIYSLANDVNNTLLILGDIHTNNHISNILVDNKLNPIFCKDTYVSIKHVETNRTYHILIDPPTIPKNKKFQIFFNHLCDFVPYIIMPNEE